MIVVTGGGGFIGTNLVKTLPADTRVIDYKAPRSIDRTLDYLSANTTAVVHLAANADVRNGWNNPTRDIQSNLMLTQRLLETMRMRDVRRLVFASTGSVYHPAPHFHDEGKCIVQATSLYAASKIACEQLISAYVAAGYLDATILRFVSVLGPHCSHGLVPDFVHKLQANPKMLEVIAPGTSRKSYVHVADVVNAINAVLTDDYTQGTAQTFNVGTADTATPVEIGQWVIDAMGLDADISLVGNTWVGDNPTIRLSTAHLHLMYGWLPQRSIRDAVEDTVRWATS